MKSAKENEEFGPIMQKPEGNQGYLRYGFTDLDLRSSGPADTTQQGIRDDERTHKQLCKDPSAFSHVLIAATSIMLPSHTQANKYKTST